MLFFNNSTCSLSIKRADIVQGKYLIAFGDQEYYLVLQDNKIVVFDEATNPVGSIRMASPTSGGLWLSEDFVGEYRLEESGHYNICAVQDGFKVLDRSLSTDPLEHLLSEIQSR